MSDTKKTENNNASAILIIANRPKSFESAANFLSRRGHPCSAVSNIKQAIKTITEQKPGLVLLSWNLKNANAIKTHKLISATFNALVIVFAESPDGKTAAELKSSRLPETMQAPVSGPGIYMKIQRIMKAREEAENTASETNVRSSSGEKVAEPDKIEILGVKSSEVPAEGEWELAGKDEKTGKNKWRLKSKNGQMLGDKSGSFTYTGDTPPTKNKSGTWQTEENKEISFEAKTSNFKTQKQLTDKEIEELASQLETEGENEEDTIIQKGQAAAKAEEETIQKGYPANQSKMMEAVQKGLTSNEYNETQEGPGQGKKFSLTQEGPSANKFNEIQEGSEQNKHSLMQEGQGRTKPHLLMPSLTGRGAGTALAKLSMRALQESVIKDESADIKEISEISRVAVMTIDSKTFKGYLIATSSEQNHLDRNVLGALKSNITKYLKDEDANIQNIDSVEVFLEQVNFPEWSMESGEFTAIAPHGAEQWALAFFTEQAIELRIKKESQGMTRVDIEDVIPEVSLTFDLFIHFPLNQKYLHYCKEGKHITEKQRSRMRIQQVNRFYIKDEDSNRFVEFCLSNRINAKIVNFKKSYKIRAS